MGEQDKDTALFGECKWTNEKVDAGVLETLIKRSQLFHYKIHDCICSQRVALRKAVRMLQTDLEMLLW